MYLDYFVPAIGDVPEEDYVLPLDVESAAALGNALLAVSKEAERRTSPLVAFTAGGGRAATADRRATLP